MEGCKMTVQIAGEETPCDMVLINRIGNRIVIIAEINKLPRAIITLEEKDLDKINNFIVRSDEHGK